jgi:hypothetical protein
MRDKPLDARLVRPHPLVVDAVGFLGYGDGDDAADFAESSL